jgi:hypothetical protein
MQRTEQQQTDDTPVISPLAKDKTYGERWYHSVFDWGLNYWTNLLASAGFSQYAEHATRSVKVLGMKNAASPRELQEKLATWIVEKDPFMNGKIPFTQIDNPLPFMGGFKNKMLAEKPAEQAAIAIAERSMARARSLTLLMPGFLVVIPTVWLGAKIKPWFVETLDKRHYGAEAMDDPTLKARHQAIEAEARPTFLGAFIGRLGTMLAVQLTAQSVGSENNFVNKIGDKINNQSLKKFGVDPLTKSIGESIGGSLPLGLRERYNGFARRHGLSWSEEQVKKFGRTGVYSSATEDLGRFVATDTFYTMVTALTIHPVLKLLRYVPFMSYKPKVPANSATFDANNNIKVPANHYADAVPDLSASEAAPATPTNETAALARADESTTTPGTRVSGIRGHIAPNQTTQHEALVTAR